MPSLKTFADLGNFSKQLKLDAERRAREDAARREQARKAKAEANLFRDSVGEVSQLKKTDRILLSPAPPPPFAYQHLADEELALSESLSDEFDPASLLETDESLSFLRVGVGQDVARKLRKGFWSIQAHLDLHGLRRDEAREALSEFLRRCQRNGHRCIRIVHGKGLGSFNREPILKQKVKNWLIQKEEVIAFVQATAADGGSGAILVLLKSA